MPPSPPLLPMMPLTDKLWQLTLETAMKHTVPLTTTQVTKTLSSQFKQYSSLALQAIGRYFSPTTVQARFQVP